jgi:hypothetical protein
MLLRREFLSEKRLGHIQLLNSAPDETRDWHLTPTVGRGGLHGDAPTIWSRFLPPANVEGSSINIGDFYLEVLKCNSFTLM